ncbi:DUF6248 family natural product biosynthesis protein [Streptomyces yaizuensis]|uniref:DUF6248 family natural product biosynthesis protein n=1 Tax=Streptomyces yaizuensis TaxID=2989713 RepID=UPI00389AFD91
MGLLAVVHVRAGTCWNCLAGDCAKCLHRQKGRLGTCANTGTVHGHRGRHVAELILRPGGEPCVWWCRCTCPKDSEDGKAPTHLGGPAAVPPPDRTRPVGTRRSRGRGQHPLPGL